jgi:hypothetical protein
MQISSPAGLAMINSSAAANSKLKPWQSHLRSYLACHASPRLLLLLATCMGPVKTKCNNGFQWCFFAGANQGNEETGAF